MRSRTRTVVTTLLDVVGAALIVGGAVLIFWPAALVVAGVGALAVSRRLT